MYWFETLQTKCVLLHPSCMAHLFPKSESIVMRHAALSYRTPRHLLAPTLHSPHAQRATILPFDRLIVCAMIRQKCFLHPTPPPSPLRKIYIVSNSPIFKLERYFLHKLNRQYFPGCMTHVCLFSSKN